MTDTRAEHRLISAEGSSILVQGRDGEGDTEQDKEQLSEQEGERDLEGEGGLEGERDRAPGPGLG